MTTRSRTTAIPSVREAVVWVDHRRAVIVEQRARGRDCVEVLDRLPTETAATFDTRTVERIADRDRVMVAGPADARTEFERTYVAITHRPDRLLDVEFPPSKTQKLLLSRR
jgi:hypothetical protein